MDIVDLWLQQFDQQLQAQEQRATTQKLQATLLASVGVALFAGAIIDEHDPTGLQVVAILATSILVGCAVLVFVLDDRGQVEAHELFTQNPQAPLETVQEELIKHKRAALRGGARIIGTRCRRALVATSASFVVVVLVCCLLFGA